MHSEPMIAVANVPASVAWYRKLLGCSNDHDLEEFDRLLDGDRVLLMLHQKSAPEHGLRPPVAGAEGSGMLVWFFVDDAALIHRRAKKLKASIVTDPHTNPQTGWREFTVRDPDGYHIAIVET